MSLRFLRHARQGASVAIAGQLGAPGALARPPVSLRVDLLQDSNAVAPVYFAASLLGPADVLALDVSQIKVRFPMVGAVGVPTDAFAHVEFKRPDLPWIFTPVAPTPVASPPSPGSDRLPPWLCLLVVAQQEGVSLTPRQGLPSVLEVASPARRDELPTLSDCAAWAHVQMDAATAEDDVGAALAQSPERFRSRLVAPRALAPDVTYLACLVPTFLGGRRTALGEPLAAGEEPLAWAFGPSSVLPIRLPVFDSWTFTTGQTSSFQGLVRSLVPRRELPAGVGARPLDASAPGGGLPRAPAGLIVQLDGALRVAELTSTPGPAATQLAGQLLGAVDRPGEFGPPRYGRWHAGVPRTPGATGVAWLDDLNGDPSRRVAAALGAQVVEERQDELMAACWSQVGEILRANQLLRGAELASEVAGALFSKRIVPRSAGATLLTFAGPAAARIRVEAWTTLAGAVHRSCLPQLVLSGAFRKWARPSGPVARRFRRCGLPDGAVDQPQVDAAPRLPLEEIVSRLAQGGAFPAPVTIPVGAAGVTLGTLLRNLGRVGRTDLLGRLGDAQLAIGALGRSTPTACTGLPLATLGSAVEQALRPDITVPARVSSQLTLPDGIVGGPRAGTLLAAPRIATPMVQALIRMGLDWLLPGLGAVPQDTLALVEPNRPFIEAYMAGLNHAMGRELLWRGFPTDQRGTVFTRFWDGPGDDVAPLHLWRGSLGSHPGTAGPALSVVLLRGPFVARFPDATLFLQRARYSSTGGREPVPAPAASDTLTPLFRGRLDPDVLYVGFAIGAAAARGRHSDSATGDPGDPGWFLAFQEQPGVLRFGPPAGTAPGWYPVTGQSDAAADSLLRRPYRLYVHAEGFLPGS
jgi:hypothetical protein